MTTFVKKRGGFSIEIYKASWTKIRLKNKKKTQTKIRERNTSSDK